MKWQGGVYAALQAICIVGSVGIMAKPLPALPREGIARTTCFCFFERSSFQVKIVREIQISNRQSLHPPLQIPSKFGIFDSIPHQLIFTSQAINTAPSARFLIKFLVVL